MAETTTALFNAAVALDLAAEFVRSESHIATAEGIEADASNARAALSPIRGDK